MASRNRCRWRLLCILLAAMTAVSLFFPVMPVHAAQKEILVPSPVDYFGEPEETETGKTNTAFYFYGYPDFPEAYVQTYVDALTKLGLTSDRPSISQTVNLQDNGKTCVQIVWQSGKKYEGGYIRVNIVQPYVPAAPTGKVVPAPEEEETVIILSPNHYFGEVDRVERGENSTTLLFEGFRENPKEEMQTYVEAFKAAGFTGFITVLSDGDREAVMKFGGYDCLWLRWDKSEKCVRLTMLNELPIGEETDPEASLNEMLEAFFGAPKKVEYNEEEEHLIYAFGFSEYPTSEMKAFLQALAARGLTAGDPFTASSGTSQQKVLWKEDTCLVIWWLPKTEKLEITAYRAEAEKAGLLAAGDIPESTEPEEPAPTVPAPTEPRPTTPTDSPNAITNIVRNIFGAAYKTEYKEDRYETRMYFHASAEPKTAFSNFRRKMESLGLKVRTGSYSSNGGRKEIGAKAEGGTPVMASWKKKEGIIEVTIKWEYIQKAGVFDTSDIPAPAETEPPSPNPGDKVRCNVCFGDGKCSKCRGSGEVAESLHGKPWVTVMQTCNRCWGTKACDSCDKGWVDP